MWTIPCVGGGSIFSDWIYWGENGKGELAERTVLQTLEISFSPSRVGGKLKFFEKKKQNFELFKIFTFLERNVFFKTIFWRKSFCGCNFFFFRKINGFEKKQFENFKKFSFFSKTNFNLPPGEYVFFCSVFRVPPPKNESEFIKEKVIQNGSKKADPFWIKKN